MSKADPFGRSAGRRPSTVQTSTLLRSNHAANQTHDLLRDPTVPLRSSSRGTTVWEIGGPAAISDERFRVVDESNRLTARGAHVPVYTSRFLDSHRINDEMTSFAARLLLALDIDPSNRILAPPLISSQPQMSGPAKSVLNRRLNPVSAGKYRRNQVKPIWKDSQWTDIGSIACTTRVLRRQDALH